MAKVSQQTGYSLDAGVGAAKGAFVNANVGRISYESSSAHSTIAGASVGYSVDLDPGRTVQFCPIAGFSHIQFPDLTLPSGGGAVEQHANALSFGGMLGARRAVSPGLELVPTVGAAYVRQSGTASFEGTSQSETRGYGIASLGAGLVINQRLTLQPSISIPFGIRGTKSSFGFSAAVNFGR